MSLITPDFGLLVWMVLIFGIVFFLLAKFGFPLITGMVDKRAERIESSIAKAKEAEERLSALAQEQEKILQQARIEKTRILKETAEARDSLLEQAKAQASEEAAKIISKAKAEIEAERESAIRDLRSQVASLSVTVAEKILLRELDSSDGQKALIDTMVDEASSLKID